MIVQISPELRVAADSMQWVIQQPSTAKDRDWRPVNWGAYHASLGNALRRVARYEFMAVQETVSLRQCHDLCERIATLLSATLEAPAGSGPTLEKLRESALKNPAGGPGLETNSATGIDQDSMT